MPLHQKMSSGDEVFNRQRVDLYNAKRQTFNNEDLNITQQNTRNNTTVVPLTSQNNIKKNVDGTTIISLSDLKGKGSGKFITQQPGTLTD